MLSSKDYDKLLQFLLSIQPNTPHYRETVLDQLKNLYGYSHMTFFFANNSGNLRNPIASNITNYFLEIYDQYFHKVDLFNSLFNNSNQLMQKNVVSITDLMSYNQFVNTEYYNDFFKKMNLYYEVVLPLKVDDKLLGMIGVFKPKDEGEFTQKDLLIFSNLNKHIASNLSTFLQINQLQNEQYIYKSCSSQSPMGILILSQDLRPLYFNEKGSHLCMDITSYHTIQGAIQNVIHLIADNVSNHNFNDTITLNSCQLKIHPQIVTNAFGDIETIYFIYINKNTQSPKELMDKIVSLYSLSRREKEVVELMYKGLSNQEISETLFISIHTVKSHIENVFKKMKIHKRTSLINNINEVKNIL